MRWGIWDVEAWRQTLDPKVISCWLTYAQVEPEIFFEGGRQSGDGRQSEGHVHMVEAWKAYGMLSRKYGR